VLLTQGLLININDLSFSFFSRTVHSTLGLWNRQAADSRLYATHTLATKQRWLKSGGLQNLVSYAKKV